MEEGHKIGQKPLTPKLIETVLARDLDDLEPHLSRHGYNVKALAELLHVRPTDVRAFRAGRLPAQPDAGVAAVSPRRGTPTVSR